MATPLIKKTMAISWLSYGDLECSIPLGWVGRFFVDWGDSAAEKAALS